MPDGFDVDRALAQADAIPKLEQHRLRPSQQLESEITTAAARDGLTAGFEMLVDEKGNMRWIAVVITGRGAMRQVVAEGPPLPAGLASPGAQEITVDEAWRRAFAQLGVVVGPA